VPIACLSSNIWTWYLASAHIHTGYVRLMILTFSFPLDYPFPLDLPFPLRLSFPPNFSFPFGFSFSLDFGRFRLCFNLSSSLLQFKAAALLDEGVALRYISLLDTVLIPMLYNKFLFLLVGTPIYIYIYIYDLKK
jgi:hypothetical protein